MTREYFAADDLGNVAVKSYNGGKPGVSGKRANMVFTNDSYYQETFSKLSFTKEIIKSKDFEECEFSNCSFIDCKFESCKFIACKFNNCILSSIKPVSSRFREVSFSLSKVMGVDWTVAAHLTDLEFTGCQINYSNFMFLKLPKIKIVNCEAKEVDFTESDLSEGNFKNTDLEKSKFFKTNLAKADFTGAKNYYIDIINNTLKKTRFSLPEALSLLNSLDIIID